VDRHFFDRLGRIAPAGEAYLREISRLAKWPAGNLAAQPADRLWQEADAGLAGWAVLIPAGDPPMEARSGIWPAGTFCA
jgi:hypothetical protein